MTGDLEIQPADTGLIRLVQITDTHIMGEPGDRFDGVDTAATLSVVRDAIREQEPAPDLVLVTGDLVHEPSGAAYDRLLALLKPMGFPMFCLPGNHDDPGLIRHHFRHHDIRTDSSIRAGPWRILMLDTWQPGSHAGRLPEKELSFLEEQLGSMRESHALIALHHPPVSVDSPWMDAMGLENADEFLSVIDNYPAVRAVVWGHIHQEYATRRNGVQLLGTPSTCVQFTPGTDRYIRDSRQPGFRRLILYADGSINTQVARVG